MTPGPPIVEHVPTRLRNVPRWVGWKYIERDGKPTKCPVNPKTGRPADSTNQATWGTFDEAIEACRKDTGLAGIGFVFTQDGGFCGVDLDDSIDPATGRLKPWAEEIVRRLDSYSEISPSGRGAKVFLRARKPGSRCRKAWHDGEVEIYDAKRFFTLTGARLPNVPTDVEEHQDALADLYRTIFGQNGHLQVVSPVPAAAPPRLVDDEIFTLASRSRRGGEKFSLLWDGFWNNYFNSPSEADLSLCCMLAFYTKDPAQIDRLFRHSRLMRGKWDESRGDATYGEVTIRKALLLVRAQYTPRRSCGRPAEADLREDVRNGQVFAEAYAERVRYCPDLEAWLIWDDRRWGRDKAHEVERLMQDLARERLGAAAHIEDHDDRQRELKHWHSSMRMHRVQAALQAARSHPSLIIRLKDFDVNPLLLNVLNGTLDLRTARLRSHNPADRITMLAPVAHDAEADQGEWLRFLRRIVPDKAMRLFLQRAVGYSLTGSAEEEVLFFVSGPTASGKSTFVSAIRAALGDYAAAANFETFVRRRDVGGPRSDLVRLAGKRFVGSIEVEDGAALAAGLVKWLTGQDALCVRGLYQSEVEFLPSFKLWLVANRQPRAADDDGALWRRILLVPFEQSIPEAERDPAVKQRLSDPAIGGPAILAWAVQGCLDWQQHRLRVPEAVKAATRAWRVENDPLADWVGERTVRGPQAATPFKGLNANYREWAEGLGLQPISAKKLAQRLQALGCTVEHTRRGRLYHGVGLVPGL